MGNIIPSPQVLLVRKSIATTLKSQITVHINRFEKLINEGLEGSREIIIGLAYTICLDSLLKLFCTDFSVLQIFRP